MTLHETRVGDSLTVAVEGRLDAVSAPELTEYLDSQYPTVQELTFDFEKMEYISSAGLRAVLQAQKKMQDCGGIRIVNTCKPVYDVFKLTGLTEVLRFE